jgi:NADP-dependent 3-hydroxy acid dehydrogenase YdfG
MKNVIITGASSGIGRATAVRLGARGYRLALLARRRPELEAVAAEVTRAGGEAIVRVVDVVDQRAVEEAVSAILEEWGHIDVVLVNAGVRPEIRLDEASVDVLRANMETNYFGAAALTYAVLPSMKERRAGHLIFMNTLNGRWSNRLEGPYVATKHALLGFAGVARKEFGDLGIAVTSILPGRVDTPMIDHLKVPSIQPKMSPEVVAKAVVKAIDKRPAEMVLPPFRGRLLITTGVLFPRFADRLADLLRLEGLPE